jgi:hypothetical protein|tara:strand:+ start:383 stop:568 length:186 start_codon:yes stop_codon:yes gene_type:complete
MSRTKIPVRFADSTSTTTNIEIDPSKLRDVQILDKEVFATIDEIRIAMTKKDYNKLFENEE